MQMDLLSEAEQQRFEKSRKEAVDLSQLALSRIATATDSFRVAQVWFDQARSLFLDGIVQLSEDPRDNFETAFDKANKLERIEQAFDAASLRLNFELRQLQKMGISPARDY